MSEEEIPDGWYTFGTHTNHPGIKLEFQGEGGGGMPLYERPIRSDNERIVHHMKLLYTHWAGVPWDVINPGIESLLCEMRGVLEGEYDLETLEWKIVD